MNKYPASIPVKTKTVEIKVLHVDGKTMSLAMVRQLEKQTIIDPDDGELLGLEWGRIRYVWPGCCEKTAGLPIRFHTLHDHIIWEKEGRLFLSSVDGEYDRTQMPHELREKFRSQVDHLKKLDQLFIGV